MDCRLKCADRGQNYESQTCRQHESRDFADKTGCGTWRRLNAPGTRRAMSRSRAAGFAASHVSRDNAIGLPKAKQSCARAIGDRVLRAVAEEGIDLGAEAMQAVKRRLPVASASGVQNHSGHLGLLTKSHAHNVQSRPYECEIGRAH